MMKYTPCRLFRASSACRTLAAPLVLRHRAFTLIELLTVIAIIGVLAAITIPVVGRVREKARAAQCTSNLRQLSTALLLYASENKQMIPAVYATNGDLKDSWCYVLWPYAGYSPEAMTKAWSQFSSAPNNSTDPANVFICPTTRTLKKSVPGYGSVVPNDNLFSYGLNSVSTDGSTWWMKKTSLASIDTPSRTSMVCESSYLLGDEYGYRSLYGLLPHQGAANFAFFDGHVQRLAKANIPDVATAAGRTFWQGR
ncbi:prepilin-type N-terminal cleavage/methylation domain-containing protein [Opitutaceae bacterium TAV1]|nr:prepilin-type N-terminal cleavage/methylation domain-containing protein [Opitutaceae bacterium TAV1]